MKRYWVLPTILSVLLVVSGVLGYNQYLQRQQYRTYLDNQYQRSFYELVGNVGNLETKLSKMMVTATPSQNVVMLTDIWRQSDAAQSDLGQLPISHIALSNTAKFINQLGDYCYYLSKKISDGKTITTKDMTQLTSLHNNAVTLNDQLRKLENQMNSGQGPRWSNLWVTGARRFDKASDNIQTRQFSQIEKTSTEYPVLIYDGPFSESLEKQVPKGLGNKDISFEEAQKVAMDFLGGDRIQKVKKSAEGNGKIKTWGIEGVSKKNNRPIMIHVSKKGGQVLWMVENSGNLSKKLTVSQCSDKGLAFLKSKGFLNMVPTYKQYYDGVAVINYALKKDNVIIYPDQIKVKVSMEDGSIVGYEANNYLMSHADRNIPKPSLSPKQAQEYISQNLKISSVRLAVIPTETRGEKLCYEFKGTFKNENFIIYINAVTGKEENVLKIIDTQNGSLVL